MNKMQELIELDVTDSMKRNIEALFLAMDTIDSANPSEAKEKLDNIHRKVEEIEEYFWRPVDSRDVYEKLTFHAKELGDKEKSSHYQYQIKLMRANDLEFKGRVQDFYGNKVKAVEYYAEALELIPVHELAGPAHTKALKSIEKARNDTNKIEKRIAAYENDSKMWFKYGMAHLNLGKVEKSIEYFDKVIELDPINPDAYARRGTAMESLGDYEGAKKFFEKALELKPTSMIAKRGLNYAEYFLEHGSK
ncbi:MAG: tetratricopeptide repeat protein [Thermoplasmata archaeon]|nr:MAG: tetratricopeptide repeat protein [Thermoplasmata archaeon]